jgi:drug/metabolite transporter (DMT)-like permease
LNNDIGIFKKTLAGLGLFYAAAIWGSTFFIVKSSLRDIDPVTLVGYRFLLAAALLAIMLIIFKKPLLANVKQGLVLGIFLWILYISQTIGLKFTTASNSGFITGLFVAFVPIFSLILFRKKPNKIALLAVAISLAGLWFLTGGLSQINLGDLLTLLAAMAYAIHILYADRYMKAGTDPYVVCFQQFAFVGLLSLITAAIFGRPFAIATIRTTWVILFLTIFPTLSAFVIQLVGQRIISPIRVSLIFAFEPVFAAVFAWTLGGEQIMAGRAMGGLLIFLAMIISGLPSEKKNTGII